MTEKEIYFTRSGTSHNLSMGIVGLPNVGKSTLFNILTSQNVPSENYPFCTINPSEGRLIIQDPRIDRLVSIYKPKSIVNSYLSVVDIAGLIKGASTGLGLGNNFLEHIRRTDGIFQVVRCFEDNCVVHCEDSLDSTRDVKIVNDELRLKDKEMVDKKLEKFRKESRAKSLDKTFMAQLACLEKISEILNDKWVNTDVNVFTNDDIKFINTLNLLTAKNVVYLANISESDYTGKKANVLLRSLKGVGQIIPFSAEYEGKNDSSKSEFISKLVKKGYESLNLINFFTAGSDEVKAWTIRKGSKITQAGGVIHSDFENYFVMAEVMSFKDLDALGSENEVKKAGKYYQRGKSYIVEDGDIIYFKSNPPKSAGKKKNFL